MSLITSVIICLPTGTGNIYYNIFILIHFILFVGKTFVSLLVSETMKELNPKKLVLFVTQNINLTYQQAEYLFLIMK